MVDVYWGAGAQTSGAGPGSTPYDLLPVVGSWLSSLWTAGGLLMRASLIACAVTFLGLLFLFVFAPRVPKVKIGLDSLFKREVHSADMPSKNDKPAPMITVHGPAQVAVGDHNVQHQTVVTGPKPRSLSQGQLASLTNALRPFRGMSINIFQYTLGERENINLTDAIGVALKAAGWIVNDVSGTEYGDKRSPRPLPGILVEVRQQAGAAASSALASALRSAGLKVDGPLPFDAFGRGGVASQGSEDPNAAIQLTVGRNLQ